MNAEYSLLKENYFDLYRNLNLPFNDKKITNKLKIGIYSYYRCNGGRARTTSLLLNYLHRINIFSLYLFTRKADSEKESEYYIKDEIFRINMRITSIKNLNKEIRKKKKIYNNYTAFKSIYEAYHSSKYIVSLIHLENDYIFKKWGIESIFMYNFITYDLKRVIPSDLLHKNIIMLGRAENRFKRFKLGIYVMEYIIQEIPECKMKILSEFKNVHRLLKIIDGLNLKYNVKFYGYTSTPEIFSKKLVYIYFHLLVNLLALYYVKPKFIVYQILY